MRKQQTQTTPVREGQTAPPFFLKTAYGVEVNLASCLLQGPAVVEFLRGSWDPDSRKRLDELAEQKAKFDALGARVLVVACERPETLNGYLEQKPTPLTVLADEDRNTARAYGVYKRFTLPVGNTARPSTFVVDRCGFVRFAYVSRLSIHSADCDEVLRILADLKKG